MWFAVVRCDACGLCFSDIKVINAGEKHPRIYRSSLKEQPLTLGHEVTLTVVGVGETPDKLAVRVVVPP